MVRRGPYRGRVIHEAEAAAEPWDDLSVPVAKTIHAPAVVHVVYAQRDGRWHASSPELGSLEGAGDDLEELQERVRARNAEWLRPDIGVIEHVEAP